MSRLSLDDNERFAVLLNPNARMVNNRVARRINELVDPTDVFVSHSPDEASSVMREIAGRGYGTVFTGGGDGTVTNFINRYPTYGTDDARIGILRLGAGNAMSEIVSSGDPLSDLRQYIANPSADSTELALCESEGTRFAFASMGLDAQILTDYQRLHARFGRLAGGLENVGGYMAAAFGLTLPRLLARRLRRQQLQVRVVNTGAEAYAITTDGRGNGTVGKTFAPGEVLYEGPVNRALFGTCPFYGYRVSALPFAGLRNDRFHLRLSNVSPGRMLWGLRKIWKGTFRHDELHDFHVERAQLEFSEPVPYMRAGEVQGFRETMSVGMAERPVELVRFF